MNRADISYERNMTGSFMKIPAKNINEFDENILLRKKFVGLLTMEKTYINDVGQYWYNISGKQSLETVCSIKSIGLNLIEQIILSICSEIEILESNMIDSKCLMLNPDMIYITNQNGEIIFMAYPGENQDVSMQFQSLMEFLLTKIDHSNPQAVHSAYSIYEKTLDSSYSIMDLRSIIIATREKAAKEQYAREQVIDEIRTVDIMDAEDTFKAEDEEISKDSKYNNAYVKGFVNKNNSSNSSSVKDTIKSRIIQFLKEILEDIGLSEVADKLWTQKESQECKMIKDDKRNKKTNREKIKGTRGKKKKDNEDDEFMVCPEELIIEEEIEPVINPTICLTDYNLKPQGRLIYEGNESQQDITVVNSGIKIGKGIGVDVAINKDTVSHFHARITRESQEFYIEDLNSTNGTFINDNPLPYRQRQLLKINDTIRFADVKYRFI